MQSTHPPSSLISTLKSIGNDTHQGVATITISNALQGPKYMATTTSNTLKICFISPTNGLVEFRSLKVSQYFTQQTTTPPDPEINKNKRPNVRDTFNLHPPKPTHQAQSNVKITDVAWAKSAKTAIDEAAWLKRLNQSSHLLRHGHGSSASINKELNAASVGSNGSFGNASELSFGSSGGPTDNNDKPQNNKNGEGEVEEDNNNDNDKNNNNINNINNINNNNNDISNDSSRDFNHSDNEDSSDDEHNHSQIENDDGNHNSSLINKKKSKKNSKNNNNSNIDDNDLIAVAGSNGVILIWNTDTLGLSNSSSSHNANFSSRPNSPANIEEQLAGKPEGILSGHSRAVNKLAWHPNGPVLMLSASQDSTVKLWDRRAPNSEAQQQKAMHKHLLKQQQQKKENKNRSWFGLASSNQTTVKMGELRLPPSWQNVKTFNPKSEAVRDVEWSPFESDSFACVTDSGYLLLFDVRFPVKPYLKIAAHSGEATTVSWHPSKPWRIATGGGRDKQVKIWDLETGQQALDLSNANAERISQGNNNSYDSVGTNPFFSGIYANTNSNSGSCGSNSNNNTNTARSNKSNSSSKIYSNVATLTAAAPITRVRWRPRAKMTTLAHAQQSESLHDPFIGVATAPQSGAADSSGSISLWSIERPFLPISVVDNHSIGAVTDFVWLDTPILKDEKDLEKEEEKLREAEVGREEFGVDEKDGDGEGEGEGEGKLSKGQKKRKKQKSKKFGNSRNSNSERFTEHDYDHVHDHDHDHDHDHERGSTSIIALADEIDLNLIKFANIWQHVCSVGRDGKVLIQSLARGYRPTMTIPSSVVALRPIGGGASMHMVSVHQSVANKKSDDYDLTKLVTGNEGIGIFRENDEENSKHLYFDEGESRFDKGLNNEVGVLLHNSFCDADAWDTGGGVGGGGNLGVLSPELVHIKFFAENYRTKGTGAAELFRWNAKVAGRVKAVKIQKMWSILEFLVDDGGGSGKGGGRRRGGGERALGPLFNPTVKNLLLERGDFGDIQSCVTICEIVDIFNGQGEKAKAKANTEENSMPKKEVTEVFLGIEINIVREWYLSYVDLMQRLEMFERCTELLANCVDSVISTMNQQSTQIYESCSSCNKPLRGVFDTSRGIRKGGGGERGKGGERKNVMIAQRACNSCRVKIGICFICHAPVKSLFVWCPGCGCGGHQSCAKMWFHGSGVGGVGGGSGGSAGRRNLACPTGCGHKCGQYI